MLKNILISKLFGLELLDVALDNYKLDLAQKNELETKFALLNTGMPMDYLIGKVKVLGLDLIVNKYTLIPREETEHWLQKLKQNLLYDLKNDFQIESGYNNKKNTKIPSQTLIDLGTGTGLIGLYLSDIYDKVCLVDIDKNTLETTKSNIKLNNKKNCQTYLSNGLANIEEIITHNTKWDLVANLPYLPQKDNSNAAEYKVEYEPAIALYSGDDGLYLFGKVLQQIQAIKNKPQKVIFELDPRNIRQAQLQLNKLNYQTEIWLDQNYHERVIFGVLAF